MDKLRLLYEQTGRAAWISHLDMMRMLQRAFNRAGIALKYSEGFNPHAKISVLMPLSVGTESLCQLADVELQKESDLQELPQRLNAVVPEGVHFLKAYREAAKPAELKELFARISFIYDRVPAPDAVEKLDGLFAANELIVNRKTKRGEGEFDIRPCYHGLQVYATDRGINLEAFLSASEPVLRPELLTAAVGRYMQELMPDEVHYKRVQLFHVNGSIFH